MHAHVAPVAEQSTLVDWNKVGFGGVPPDFAAWNASMHHIRADATLEGRYDNLLLLILDGTGTTMFEPLASGCKALSYCYWKKEYQIRWYIATDAIGRILFVSTTYSGKTDDVKALEMTGFYQ